MTIFITTEITTLEDQEKGQRTYASIDGKQFITFSAKAIETYGLHRCLQMHGCDWQPDMTPMPVYQSGRMVGTLPASWDYRSARSTMLYVPRASDFQRSRRPTDDKLYERDVWVADPMLGPGDLLHAGVNMIDKPDW